MGSLAQEQPKKSRRRQGGKGKPFPKGVSGNPGGRPKGRRTLMEVVRGKLSTPGGDESELEAAADAYVDAMKAGSFQHQREYIEREDGKVPDRTIGGPGVTVNVTQISEDDLVRIATRGRRGIAPAAAGEDQP